MYAGGRVVVICGRNYKAPSYLMTSLREDAQQGGARGGFESTSRNVEQKLAVALTTGLR